MNKKILGLDLGTNSIGWALLEESNGKPSNIIDIGVRIFPKAVEEKTPTPKNAKRRNARLARRVNQRRARRKQRMLNYLVHLDLLPKVLQGHTQPEVILNELGDPYQLRAKALDKKLNGFELGRVFLHLVQRRGFLSNRKTLIGDMLDDPDVLAVIEEVDAEEDNSSERAKEESAFKNEISELRKKIATSGFRTLGEYLASLDVHDCKRNRSREGGHLRTDRQMYRDELDLIWKKQSEFHSILTMAVKEQLEEIIFFQRPLKLRAGRIGKCSLEPSRSRANVARLEVQRFRYLQDINNLKWFDRHAEIWREPTPDDRKKLMELFEKKANPTFKTDVRKALGLDKGAEFNLEADNKKLRGNTTACEIRKAFPQWDELEERQKFDLVEDLLTINKKSVLKNRLLNFWKIDVESAVRLCMLDPEPGHSNLSVKAIRKLLPYLEQGMVYSDARVAAGYGYETKDIDVSEKLPKPDEIPNPIVNKALHEVRRVVNALIKEYGKPDAIRIEMARDLEMNTKKYKAFLKQQKANSQANDEAVKAFHDIGLKNPHLNLRKYPSHTDKLRYRLWKDQGERCAYSNKTISLTALFSAEIDIDHIIPYSQSLDDSYMNKVVCFSGENRYKGQRTPYDAWGGNEERWNQITQAIGRWQKNLSPKKNRFYMKDKDVVERDFISSQLNDTRYISKMTLEYVKQLGVDVSVSKGVTTSWLRHMWGLNSLLGETDKKERTDHRHHAVDALVVACVNRQFYKDMVGLAKKIEKNMPGVNVVDEMHFDLPWKSLRSDLDNKLKEMIVSHASQHGVVGALHEETGAGYIEGVGTVYRANLDGAFKIQQLQKIVDDDVKEIVRAHLNKYGDNPKAAFAEGVTVFHKDGKTPIKRVRIVQSKTTLDKLQKAKFGVRNRDGKVFKWMAYGNMHHVEVIKDKKTGKYSGIFVTAMEAAKRVRGIGIKKQPLINQDHGEGNEFVMALHINDMVSVDFEGERRFYRVQKLDSGSNRMVIRLHTASTLKNKNEEIFFSFNLESFSKWGLQKFNLNAIGKRLP